MKEMLKQYTGNKLHRINSKSQASKNKQIPNPKQQTNPIPPGPVRLARLATGQAHARQAGPKNQ